MEKKDELITLKEFKKKDERYRIEAVVHDGQWITLNKWAKLAATSQDKIREYIEENKDKIISSRKSFRVSGKDIIEWHNKHNIPIGTSIVPNNFPPRIYKGMSEVEWIEQQSRVFVSFVYVRGDNEDVLKKIIKISKFYGVVIEDERTELSIQCLDPSILRARIMRALTAEEASTVKVTSYKNALRRSFRSLPEDLKEEFIEHYIGYARNSLKGHTSTLKMFLGKQEEIDSQIVTWIIEAYNKFNNTKNVPFSAYLYQVLQKWPYNLSVEAMGPELDRFVRRFKKEQESVQESLEISLQLEAIYERMPEYSKLKFKSLYEEMINWKYTKMAYTSDAETVIDQGILVGSNSHENSDNNEVSSSILMAILKAGVESEDSESAFNLIRTLSVGEEISEKDIEKLSVEFLEELWEAHSGEKDL